MWAWETAEGRERKYAKQACGIVQQKQVHQKLKRVMDPIMIMMV